MKPKKVLPFWEKATGWDEKPFYIKRIFSGKSIGSTEVPQCALSKTSYLYLMEGEVLVEVEGSFFLIGGGQLFLIPANMPFKILHFENIVGYAGLFELTSLRDISYRCLTMGKPVRHSFWFDEAAFIGDVMDRITAAYARDDSDFIFRAFDLVLYCTRQLQDRKAHPIIVRFMEMLSDRSQVLDSVSSYAARLNISPSYLNKLVRTQTRHSAMDWVEITRVNWAKNLLKEPDLSIAEVSEAVGIDDPSYFTRFFRRSTGMTPSEFRKKVKNVQPEWWI